MKVVIAMDSFKGSMNSMEAGYAAREGILRAIKNANIIVKPLADGGEGTTEALITGLGGIFAYESVVGPLGNPTFAQYGILKDGTAVIEMAEAAGITLVKKEELNPLVATTYGVGQMILAAVKSGCRNFIIGIGGSATTDGGVGMLQALGYEFLDSDGKSISYGIQDLDRITHIDRSHCVPELEDCNFQIACDVKNPLCGKNGAVYVYGKQKGVDEKEMPTLDKKMQHYAEATKKFTGKDFSEAEGAGAAGGLGFAFLSYLPNVQLQSGTEIILNAIQLEKELVDTDIVLTGEGQIDGQTAMGKVPIGVAQLAKKYGCKVIAFAGSVTEDATACNKEGIDAIFPIVRGVTTLENAVDCENAKRNMTMAVEQVFRLLDVK